jgi:hypothetical protein
MITQLASFVCLVLAQTPSPKQVLYKIEIIDNKGSVMKPVIRTLENEPAEIKMSMADQELKVKITPGTVDGQWIKNSIEITMDTTLLDKDGKVFGKNERIISTDTKLAIGKTTLWDVTDKGAIAIKMPKNHKAPKDDILISIEIETPNDGP